MLICSRWILHRSLPVFSGLLIAMLPSIVKGELMMSSIFGDSMVLQRDHPIHVWGWTEPQTTVTVTLADRRATGQSDQDGRFDVSLPAMRAGGPFEMTVEAGESRTFTDVLIGEVWICSGQSNMQWSVGQSDDGDLEQLAAKYPQMRIISVPQVGTQEPQRDFDGQWQSVTPESVPSFSAVGYFFGRQLHQTLDVPVGLIDNAWGGSAAEAWTPRDVLASNEATASLIPQWEQRMANYDFASQLADWEAKRAAWVAEGKKGRLPRRPRDQATGNQRPANIFNGVLLPTIGYTIRGVIWYQGESNSSRAYQYRELFPLMIQTWRQLWDQGDFPFYWVNLADFMEEVETPGDSSWAELREAQTMTQDRLPNTGEAVIIDVGEGRDIHPRDKDTVGKRLARLALHDVYGQSIAARSPRFREMTVDGASIVLTFDHVGEGLYSFDVTTPIGFTIAGNDKSFVDAEAKIIGKDQIRVSASEIENPVAVRYGWANNPVVNVESRGGLPLTPFRTDDWKGVTQP